MTEAPSRSTRRQLLSRIGMVAGTAAMYQAMTRLGHAAGSDFVSPPNLTGGKGQSVVVLGAGLAGMLAAYELRRAGYKVQILEYQNRSGGRNITLRGGDRYTELGGGVIDVRFASGNYINPGPWRLPYHHHAILHYCREFGVALEPFQQLNLNTWLHSSSTFGGKPQRYRDIMCDFTGYTAELLSKAINQGKLDDPAGKEEREILLEAMREWGALDRDHRYVKGLHVSNRRGFDHEPGGGPDGAPTPSTPFSRDDVMKSGLWSWMAFHMSYEMQPTMFQPVGGMDMIGKGFARQVGDLVTHQAKVGKIAQDEYGVTVSWTDMAHGGAARTTKADFCVCTIPLSVLTQLEVEVSDDMLAAIAAVPYASSVKLGLEFKRRFWEEDDAIYGGISFTDQGISQISYPSHGYFSKGPSVLLGGYMFGPAAYDFAGMTPEERVRHGLQQGANIHPQYLKEFSNGVGWAWSRVPWIEGCCGTWSEQARRDHYKALTTMDRRVVLAGEHASYVGCWQEGALLSSLSAVEQLHKRAVGAG